MKIIEGSITAPQGFQAAGVACGLKKNGQPDLALIISDRPAAAAGVFTKNVVKGHSLQLRKAEISAPIIIFGIKTIRYEIISSGDWKL